MRVPLFGSVSANAAPPSARIHVCARGGMSVLSPPARSIPSAGVLVPTRMPAGLGSDRPRIDADVGGYTLRWRGLVLFASTGDPMSVWTRQALGGTARPTTLGSHRVRRLTGPTGVIYAWPERGATYAILTLPSGPRSLCRCQRGHQIEGVEAACVPGRDGLECSPNDFRSGTSRWRSAARASRPSQPAG